MARSCAADHQQDQRIDDPYQSTAEEPCTNATRWREEIRGLALDVASDEIWIEQIQFDTHTPLDLETLRGRQDPVGGLLRSIDELKTTDVRSLGPVFQDLLQKLPGEVREGAECLDLTDPDTLTSLLEEAEQLLVPRLLGGDEK